MDRETVNRWVEAYERAWRTPGTGQLGDVFSTDVSYLPSPWAQVVSGLENLSAFWESEREGPDEPFLLSSEIVAVEGTTAVVRVSVDYLGADTSSWRDLWVLKFAEDGRCAAFEEWPFAPNQPDGHRAGPRPPCSPAPGAAPSGTSGAATLARWTDDGPARAGQEIPRTT